MVPLEGIRILDLSLLLPGPYCSRLLADLGAEVIKIEPRGGDMTRYELVVFDSINCNKKSICLNLKSEEGRRIFHRLAETADGILEGFRPGVTRRLGVDYDTIRKINPKIIYCSISGYGQDGPYRDRPGHDINYLGVAGVVSVSGDLDGAPAAAGGVPIADLTSSMFAALSIVAALMARERTNRGQYIDVSMTDGALSWMGYRISEYFAKGRCSKGKLISKGAYGVFEVADGRYITIGAIEDVFWRNLCQSLGREDLINDPRFSNSLARMENRRGLFSILNPIFKSRTRDEWAKILTEGDVPWGPVNTIEEVFTDLQLLSRELFEEVSYPAFGDLKQIRFPVKFSETPAKNFSSAPRPGQHAEEILLALGYTSSEIEDLRKEEVI